MLHRHRNLFIVSIFQVTLQSTLGREHSDWNGPLSFSLH